MREPGRHPMQAWFILSGCHVLPKRTPTRPEEILIFIYLCQGTEKYGDTYMQLLSFRVVLPPDSIEFYRSDVYVEESTHEIRCQLELTPPNCQISPNKKSISPNASSFIVFWFRQQQKEKSFYALLVARRQGIGNLAHPPNRARSHEGYTTVIVSGQGRFEV
ncbi:hypothetical protein M422DRAFT_42866 [Sphaerobolus stellatus SS14]|nr:hypothetical protein M422DRAFT_42866 [Sphaerobolus stellatus SS14]